MADVIQVKGLDGVLRVMRELPEHVAKKWLRGAVVKGARAVRDEARHLAPVDTGRLRRNIIIKYINERSNSQRVTYYVLVRSGKRFQKMRVRGKRGQGGQTVDNDAFYWRFLEFGTAKMSARPFMRAAFEHKRYEALGLITDFLRDGIDQSVRVLRNGG